MTRSDGDEHPEQVVAWFREHGCDFLVLSDHNHVTLLDYGDEQPVAARPLMVPGEEVSANIREGRPPAHIGAIGINRYVEPIDAGDVVSTLQAKVDSIRAAGGIASINHPNFRWAFDYEHIKQVAGASLLEVFKGHPGTNDTGAPGKLGFEEIWDAVLTGGRVIFGLATDDSHHYHDFILLNSNPGRGLVVVNAADLTVDAIVAGLETGDFYSSRGVKLTEVETTAGGCSLLIEQWLDEEYVTRFTVRDGVLLAKTSGLSPSYEPSEDAGFVRATVVSSNGRKAWTQPVFLPF